jgi:hypothetical protein
VWIFLKRLLHAFGGINKGDCFDIRAWGTGEAFGISTNSVLREGIRFALLGARF